MAQSILKYLQKVQELEGTIYTMDRMRRKLADQALQLGRKQRIELPGPRSSNHSITDFAVIGGFLGVIIAGIGSLLYVIFEDNFWTSNFIFQIILFVIMTFLLSIVAAPICALIGFVVGFIVKLVDKRRNKILDREDKIETLVLIEQDEKRVKQELVIQEKIKAQMRQIKQQRDHVKESLAQLYALNIVHPKYRSLIPITMFCEYMETGRCNSLEGHEGAYNIYEQEVRLDRIATKLDVIIQKLDSIRENQYGLYQLLSQTNSTVSKVLQENQNMMRTLGDIRENTALTAYNSHVAAVNTAAIGDMMVMKELLR